MGELRRHLREKHYLAGSRYILETRVQTLYLSKKVYFAVEDGGDRAALGQEAQEVLNILDDELADQEANVFEQGVSRDTRDTHPIFRKIGMVGFLASFSMKERIEGHLRTQSPQKPDPLLALRQLVYDYVDGVFKETEGAAMTYWNVQSLLRKDSLCVLSCFVV